MKSSTFISLLHENLGNRSSYLKYFKVQNLNELSLILPKEKKDFYAKLYKVLEKQSLSSEKSLFWKLNKSYTNPKINTLHSCLYFKNIESRSTTFLDEIHIKQIFVTSNFSKYENVKHKGFNGYYNIILSFSDYKALEIKQNNLILFNKPKS